MYKTVIAFVAMAAIGTGVFLLVRGGQAPNSNARTIKGPAPETVTLSCALCSARFKLSEAKPIPSRQGMVLCPKCARPTTMGRRLSPRGPR